MRKIKQMKIKLSELRKIIQEEATQTSYQNVKREYSAILPVVKDLLSRVPAQYVAAALEMLANEVRDGLHTTLMRKGVRETTLAEGLSVHDHIESLIGTIESSDVNSFKEYFSDKVDAAAEATGWDRKIFDALEEKAKNIIDAMRVAADARGHRGKNVDSPEFAKAKEEVLKLAKEFGE